MEPPAFNGNGYRLGPRIPLHDGPARDATLATFVANMMPSRIMRRADSSETCQSKDPNMCEKPVGSESLTIPIVLGVAIPVVAAIIAFIYFHRKSLARQKKEDHEDPNKGLDFGLDEGSGKQGKSKRRSLFFGEKNNDRRQRQLSMDMNISTPYLLPPKLQGSRESLHSLARSIHNAEDPYRPVDQLASDVHSIRSTKKGFEVSSVYTSSTNRSGGSKSLAHPPRQNSLPKSPPPVAEPFQHKNVGGILSPVESRSPPPPPPVLPTPAQDHFVANAEPNFPHAQSTPYPEDSFNPHSSPLPPIPDVQPPPPVAQPAQFESAPSPSPRHRPTWDMPPVPVAGSVDAVHSVSEVPLHASPQQAYIDHVDAAPSEERAIVQHDAPRESLPPQLSPGVIHAEPIELPHHIYEESGPFSAPVGGTTEGGNQYYDEYYQQQNYQQGPQQEYQQDYQQGYPPQDYAEYDEYDQRGRSMQRRSTEPQPEDGQYLAAPQQDTKRMSVGFRPLPPGDIMDSEDPEYRANRIRSFYKEYFDESVKQEPPPPMPQPPAQYQLQQQPQPHPPQQQQPPYPQQQQQQQQSTQYYEDYDEAYNGEAAFYDPDSHAFVMPYAQPVTRRAMTPPPRGSRLRGPPPARKMHGSVGGMSLPGGRGMLRPGSSMSNQYGPRPGSSVSNRYYGSRPGSSASGRWNQQRPPNRKKGPPPSALTTLPNPAKLKDDTFALMSATDFAPPDTFKDRAAGRSQSPAPERRPYHLNVPISSPLVSAFDDLAAIPSPHALRKSSTFTGLDFAPPRRFKDGGDNMSDAGSIRSYRSNKSGLSAMQVGALRNGAGRVSRLPGDTVFTQAQAGEQLRPSWNMRG